MALLLAYAEIVIIHIRFLHLHTVYLSAEIPLTLNQSQRWKTRYDGRICLFTFQYAIDP